LAYQIGSFHARAGEAIAAAIKRFPSICLSPLNVQFQKLLVDPLLSAIDPQETLVVVMDSLDECGTAKKREVLLEILAERLIQLPSSVRIIITTRSEHDICCAFEHQQQFLKQKLSITSSINAHDISSYLRHRMARVRSKAAGLSLGVEWPSEDDIQRLAEQTSGLFIWASTASEFIDGYNPKKRMDLVLKGEATSVAEYALDVLYRTALESAGDWDDEDFVADFTAIMGLVLTAQHPLSSTAIDLLLPGRPCMYVISHLGCVLQQNPTVRLLHPSFADFLTTRSRCGRDIWFFHPTPCKLNFAILCLRCLNQTLRRNMCNLILSMDPADETLTEDVKYACVFWIEHICEIKVGIPSVLDHLDTFLNQHLLHWLEAMSILKKSRDTIGLLDNLLAWMTASFLIHHLGILCLNPLPQSYCRNQLNLLDIVQDACHLTRTFAKTIEEHPLLVYFSALPFAPINSTIYKKFHNVDTFPTIAGGYQQTWSPQLLVMGEHDGFVRSVAFSPDGNSVASGSTDHTVRVWDATTGVQILPALHGDNTLVYAVAFAPNGTRIISGSGSGAIRIWNSSTGSQICSPLLGHEREVWAVAFSPDGTRIVSGSGDKTIRIWDASSGAEILPALRRHENSVRTVAFFPDGTRIVSGSDDHTIRVWDASSGLEVLAPLRGHDGIVRSVAVSPDGTRIVSGSHDNTIRIWDATSGAELRPALRGHHRTVNSVTFSPDGQRIASGSRDHTIRVWNAQQGTRPLLVLRGHDLSVMSVSYSPDGSWIVSGSRDKTVRVWHTRMGDTNVPRHKYVVRDIAISMDGTRVVSGSNDKTIRIWDARSGAEVGPVLRGHKDSITSVDISRNKSKIVSGSLDSTVRVWNARSGNELLAPLCGHDDIVVSVAFSPDGRLIVSGSRDKTIRVWNVDTGAEAISPISEHFVRSVAFSPDSARIMSGSRRKGKSYNVWDANGVRLSEPGMADQFPRRSVDVVNDRWIVNFRANRIVSFLPDMIDVDICSAARGTSLAIGSPGGRVFVMHFPPAIFANPESRVIEGQSRPIVRRG
jgi:WD40 repeat protein